MDDEVLLGVATPAGGWCAPAEVACVCGSTCWPHDCQVEIADEVLDLPAEVDASRGVVVLPPAAGGLHGYFIGSLAEEPSDG